MGGTRGQAVGNIVEHRLHDAGHARHHVHVADGKARRGGDRVVDQRGAARHGGHALACGIELAGRIGSLHARPGLGVRFPWNAEGLSHAFASDVVVGRADAARGEDVIVGRADLVDGGDDHLGLVRDNADFLQTKAPFGAALRDVVDVFVDGAAREDLVADDDQTDLRIGVAHEGPKGNHGAGGRAVCRRAASDSP